MVKKYCGKARPIPDGYQRLGSPYECLRTGLYLGKEQAKEKFHEQEIEARKKQKELVEKKINISKVLIKKQIAQDIEKKGLTILKREIHLDNLTKDEVRSLANRYTGTTHAIPYYSSMSKEQLINELIQRGFKR